MLSPEPIEAGSQTRLVYASRLLEHACLGPDAPFLNITVHPRQQAQNRAVASSATEPLVRVSCPSVRSGYRAAAPPLICERETLGRVSLGSPPEGISYETVSTYNADGTPTTPTISGFQYARGVAVDANGKIYVADDTAGTVTTYAADGTPTTP